VRWRRLSGHYGKANDKTEGLCRQRSRKGSSESRVLRSPEPRLCDAGKIVAYVVVLTYAAHGDITGFQFGGPLLQLGDAPLEVVVILLRAIPGIYSTRRQSGQFEA
jgi:hypothetical protein